MEFLRREPREGVDKFFWSCLMLSIAWRLLGRAEVRLCIGLCIRERREDCVTLNLDRSVVLKP